MPDAPNPPQPASPLTLAQPASPPLWQEPYLWFGGAVLLIYFAGMVMGWKVPDLDFPDFDGGGGGGGYHSSGGHSFGGK